MIQGGGGTQTTSSEPWRPQQEYLKQLFSEARGLYGEGNYEYGPGRVTGFDPASTRAFGMAEGRVDASGRSAVTRGAEGELGRTLSGEYLDPESNPWLSRTYEAGARNINRNYYDTINALGSRMEAAGRTGSGAHATGTSVAGENLATGLGDFAAKLYGGAYEGERGRMTAATGMAGQVNEMGWRDISGVRAAGRQREEQAQAELDDFVARFQQQQYGSAEKLAEFSTMLGQPISTSQGQQRNWNFGLGGGGCHAAAEFFGWFSDAWFAARRFVFELWEGEGADDFRYFYERNSVSLAAQIRNDPAVREEWRPVFEAFATLGA